MIVQHSTIELISLVKIAPESVRAVNMNKTDIKCGQYHCLLTPMNVSFKYDCVIW